jgi:hypothetical protein
MIIKLSPQRRDDNLVASVVGDILTLNGVALDFSQLPEGATLPAEAVDSEWVCGSVERTNGELLVHLLLPHGPNPSQAVAFPEPVQVSEDGPVALPFDPEPEPVEVSDPIVESAPEPEPQPTAPENEVIE